MHTETIKSKIDDFAKDIGINVDSVLSEELGSGLSKNQIAGIALTCA